MSDGVSIGARYDGGMMTVRNLGPDPMPGERFTRRTPGIRHAALLTRTTRPAAALQQTFIAKATTQAEGIHLDDQYSTLGTIWAEYKSLVNDDLLVEMTTSYSWKGIPAGPQIYPAIYRVNSFVPYVGWILGFVIVATPLSWIARWLGLFRSTRRAAGSGAAARQAGGPRGTCSARSPAGLSRPRPCAHEPCRL